MSLTNERTASSDAATANYFGKLLLKPHPLSILLDLLNLLSESRILRILGFRGFFVWLFILVRSKSRTKLLLLVEGCHLEQSERSVNIVLK